LGVIEQVTESVFVKQHKFRATENCIFDRLKG
jgi:hypothetical protein